MRNKSLSERIIVLLLLVGIPGFSACAPEVGNVKSIQEPAILAQALSNWIQVNENGFGDSMAGEVTALEAFNGYLYAGTHNPIDPALLFDGAQIFRSSDGSTWIPVTQPGFGNSHDIAPPAILDFVVFNNQIYAGTGRGNASQLWRSLNGTTWAPMDVTGFSDPDNVDITALAVYDGMIYAGVTNLVSGAQVWRSFTGDNNSWVQVAPDTPGTVPASITGFAEFDGALYAAVESENLAQIWQSFGGTAGTWTTVVNDGFGDTNTFLTGGIAAFGGSLYAGAGSTTDGAQLWRTIDGTAWEPAITPGFGDQNNMQVEAVFVFQKQLYAGVENPVTGMEIWRTADGTFWEQINLDGFGDSNNTTTNRSNAAADFLAQLYVGTSNTVDGGELWQMTEQSVATSTATDTLTFTPTNTSTNTPSFTPTNTSTNTPTDTPGFTPTNTASNTPTDTATFTATNTPVNTPTFTVTNTLTFTPTNTPVYTPTFTFTSTASDTPSITPTNTPRFTPTFTSTSTATDTPSITPTNTPTFTPTNTPSPTPLPNIPGKVTGGGNIALSAGRLTFGFVVRYDPGDDDPSGNLTFIDHSKNLHLKASSFTLLYIEGSRARYTGIGIVNGGPEVEFIVEIEESSRSDQADTFYIYIPSLNEYEAGGSLTGGNITIH